MLKKRDVFTKLYLKQLRLTITIVCALYRNTQFTDFESYLKSKPPPLQKRLAKLLQQRFTHLLNKDTDTRFPYPCTKNSDYCMIITI